MDKKDTYTEVFLKAANKEYNTDLIKSLRGQWWFSTRGKEEGGLRLTEAGIEFLEKEADIKNYKIDLAKHITISPQVLIWLDHFIDVPYYLGKNFIKVLSEKAAFEIYLFSGDVRKMGASKALHKRYNQDS